MIRVLAILLMLVFTSCSSRQETKDAAFWRMKYEALDAFVKRKGLKKEASKAVQDFEAARAVYSFRVAKEKYSLNGSQVAKVDLRSTLKTLKGDKGQVINIIAAEEAKHEDLLFLMNELSLAGFKNFNLASEKNIRPAP